MQLPTDTHPPVNCVELTIYDNDGPEGYYERLRFERSAEAVKYLVEEWSKKSVPDYQEFNYEITNYWKQGK